MSLTIAAEVVRHISLLPVTPPSSVEAPGAASGVLTQVEHPYPSLHLLSLEVSHQTNLPPPLQAFDIVSQLDKLRVCRDKALAGQEPGTPSLGPRVSPDTSPSPRKGSQKQRRSASLDVLLYYRRIHVPEATREGGNEKFM